MKKLKDCDFCFWGKLLMAIPALPVVAMIGMSFFTSDWAQLAGAAGAVGLVVWFFIWIDTLPGLSKKLYTPKE